MSRIWQHLREVEFKGQKDHGAGTHGQGLSRGVGWQKPVHAPEVVYVQDSGVPAAGSRESFKLRNGKL